MDTNGPTRLIAMQTRGPRDRADSTRIHKSARTHGKETLRPSLSDLGRKEEHETRLGRTSGPSDGNGQLLPSPAVALRTPPTPRPAERHPNHRISVPIDLVVLVFCPPLPPIGLDPRSQGKGTSRSAKSHGHFAWEWTVHQSSQAPGRVHPRTR